MKRRGPRIPINTGYVCGRLTVVKALPIADDDSLAATVYLCKCECGNASKVKRRYLMNKEVNSCGCLAKDVTRERSITHGLHKHPLYSIHRGIKSRCNNPNATWYVSYGGRGIKVCKEWSGKKGFENFYKWNSKLPLDKQWKKGKEIDRRDNDGDYAPKNCRWRSRKQNANNRRDTVYIFHNGKRYTFSRLYTKYAHESVDYRLALKRYKQDNREIMDALTTPKRVKNPDRQ